MQKQDAPVGEDDAEEEGGDVPSGPLAEAKKDFNRATGLLLDMMLKLVVGREYFASCQEIAGTAGGLMKAMQAAEEQLQSGDANVPTLLKELRAITVQFDNQTKSVAVSSAAPPPSLLMHLSREGAPAEEDGHRERVWKLVQTERRKYVTFSYPRTWAQDQILSAFRAAGKVFSESGQLNSEHRLFVASADLLHEEGDEPWNAPCPPATNTWNQICAFVKSATGPADFGMLFDGRMREIRRLNVSWIGVVSNHLLPNPMRSFLISGLFIFLTLPA